MYSEKIDFLIYGKGLETITVVPVDILSRVCGKKLNIVFISVGPSKVPRLNCIKFHRNLERFSTRFCKQ